MDGVFLAPRRGCPIAISRTRAGGRCAGGGISFTAVSAAVYNEHADRLLERSGLVLAIVYCCRAVRPQTARHRQPSQQASSAFVRPLIRRGGALLARFAASSKTQTHHCSRQIDSGVTSHVDSKVGARPKKGSRHGHADAGRLERGVHPSPAKQKAKAGRRPDRRDGRGEGPQAGHGPSGVHGHQHGHGHLLPGAEHGLRPQ